MYLDFLLTFSQQKHQGNEFVLGFEQGFVYQVFGILFE